MLRRGRTAISERSLCLEGSAPSEYGDLTHPDIPRWPDDREDALDQLVHAQGFDFHIVVGDFTEAALEDGDKLYWQEMRAWNPEAPEGGWRLAWKGDTEDGPYAWFVRPLALRPEAVAPPAQGIDLGVGVCAIADERRRQVEAEGFSPATDADYNAGELAKAALAYVQLAAMDLAPAAETTSRQARLRPAGRGTPSGGSRAMLAAT